MEKSYSSSPASSSSSLHPLSSLLPSHAHTRATVRKRFSMTRKKAIIIGTLVLLIAGASTATGVVLGLKNRDSNFKCVVEDGCRDLGYAKYKGVTDSNGVTSWLGMRYAAPPVGKLRFSAPEDPLKEDKVKIANTHKSHCLPTSTGMSKFESEDCLFLDVFAPSTATEDSKLPVYFFIQGGGFNLNANPNINASGLIQASERNMVVVGFNYRVGLYGFLAGKEIGEDASLNNGLKDQIKALEWVKKHIAQFGGDPNHVVIGGHSAGAASVVFHLTAYGGKKTRSDGSLFHGAIAGSPSMGTMLTVPENQFLYDSLVKRTGCNRSKNTLDCLRGLDVKTLQSHNTKQPLPGAEKNPLFMYSPVIDHDLVPDYTYRLLHEGKFYKVPVVFGDDQNEGTLFAPRRTNTIQESDEFLRAQFPALDEKQLAKINAYFPRSPDTFPKSGKFWQPLSNSYGAMRYTCPKISIAESFTEFNAPNQVWSYRYAVEDPVFVKAGLGTPHTAELEGIWGPDFNSGQSPTSYYSTNKEIVPMVQGYWSSFIRTLDPNTHRIKRSPEWQTWNVSRSDPRADGFRELFIKTGGTKMKVVDSYVRETCAYLISIGVDIKQ